MYQGVLPVPRLIILTKNKMERKGFERVVSPPLMNDYEYYHFVNDSAERADRVLWHNGRRGMRPKKLVEDFSRWLKAGSLWVKLEECQNCKISLEFKIDRDARLVVHQCPRCKTVRRSYTT